MGAEIQHFGIVFVQWILEEREMLSSGCDNKMCKTIVEMSGWEVFENYFGWCELIWN